MSGTITLTGTGYVPVGEAEEYYVMGHMRGTHGGYVGNARRGR